MIKNFENQLKKMARHLYDAECIRKEMVRQDSFALTARRSHPEGKEQAIQETSDRSDLIMKLKKLYPELSTYFWDWDTCHVSCIQEDDIDSMRDILESY